MGERGDPVGDLEGLFRHVHEALAELCEEKGVTIPKAVRNRYVKKVVRQYVKDWSDIWRCEHAAGYADWSKDKIRQFSVDGTIDNLYGNYTPELAKEILSQILRQEEGRGGSA